MAERKLTVQIIGDSRQLERAFGRGSKSAAGFNRDLGRLSRGALVGTGALGGLGRAAAFASASFVGGAGLVAGAKAASSAASNLAEQTSKANVVFGASSKVVQAFAKDALGLARDQALETADAFGALLRPLGVSGSQAAKTSVRLTALGRDLASFSNVPVQDALDALRSGLVGETEPLRRFGVLLSEARVQQEALRETGKKSVKALTDQEKVTARLALIFRDTAQAQGDFARTSGGLANQQRTLSRNVRNLEIAVGTGLNPTILDVTKSLNTWLGDSENQARVQRDVTEAVKVTTEAVRESAAAFRTAAGAVGGTKNAVELLLSALAAQKVLRFGAALSGLSAQALTGTGRVNALRGALLRLGALGTITVGVEVILHREQIQRTIDAFLSTHGAGFLTGKTLKLPADINASQLQVARDKLAALKGETDLGVKALDKMIAKLNELGRTGSTAVGSLPEAFQHLRREVEATGKALADTVKPPKPPKGATAAQRNTWFDAVIGRREDRVQDIAALQGQAAELGKIAATITAQIAKVHDATRKLTLQDELVQVRRQQKGVLEQIAENQKASVERALQARKETLEKIRKAVIGRQFKALGLTATGAEPVPGVKALRTEFLGVGKAVEGTFLDTKKTASLLSRIRKVLSGGLGAVADDVRSAIKQMLDDLDRQLKDHAGTLTRGRALSTNAVLSGLGLDRDTLKILEARLAGVGAGGRVLGRAGTGAPSAFGFALSGAQPIVIHNVTTLDGDVVSRSVTRHLQKSGRRTATQTTGPHAGNATGLVR
jgi:hypothetical protein